LLEVDALLVVVDLLAVEDLTPPLWLLDAPILLEVVVLLLCAALDIALFAAVPDVVAPPSTKEGIPFGPLYGPSPLIRRSVSISWKLRYARYSFGRPFPGLYVTGAVTFFFLLISWSSWDGADDADGGLHSRQSQSPASFG
jgi:hypothetical protein